MDRNTFQSTVLTVSQLTQAVKERLESGFPPLWVQGEVSNFRRQSSGHCYFSLKDAGAQIAAVMFRGAAGHVERLPRDGDQVMVAGELNLYPPRGQYQLVVRSLRFVGVGELLLKLEQLKQLLEARGWFAKEHKQSLPSFPKRIGVVTSPTGAALQDMLNILQRRHDGFQLLLNPVRVQGKEAAPEIARAITQFNTHQLVDVIIVGRGGGSIEDLWPFNEEIVAKAIYESRIPVVSAVGHETDWSLADLAADVRAPTPSAAAEIVMAEKGAQLDFLKRCREQLEQTMGHLLAHARQRLDRFATHPYFVSPYHLLGRAMQQCDDLRLELDRVMQQMVDNKRLALAGLLRQQQALRPTQQVHAYRTHLAHMQLAMQTHLSGRLQRARERLTALSDHLASLSPKQLVTKGYAILFAEKEQRVVSSIQHLYKGQQLFAQLSDGRATLTVAAIDGEEKL